MFCESCAGLKDVSRTSKKNDTGNPLSKPQSLKKHDSWNINQERVIITKDWMANVCVFK